MGDINANDSRSSNITRHHNFPEPIIETHIFQMSKHTTYITVISNTDKVVSIIPSNEDKTLSIMVESSLIKEYVFDKEFAVSNERIINANTLLIELHTNPVK